VRVARGASPTEVDVIDARDLERGDVVTGPALVDGSDTTVWVPADAVLEVDEQRTFVVEVAS
jgi:N-methylhydantoinase A/oxoprolinase/acetone carboxylase beta subunit